MKIILSAFVLAFGLNAMAAKQIYSNDPDYRKCIRFNHLLNGDENPLGDLACEVDASRRLRKANAAEEAKERHRLAQEQQEKEQLQKEKDALFPHVCVSGCADQTGKVDKKILSLGYGNTLNEASDDSNYNATSKLNCQYVAKVEKCEMAKSKVSNNYAEVACTIQNGQYLASTLTSGKGRNKLEAEMVARENLSKKFVCKYGTAIIKMM